MPNELKLTERLCPVCNSSDINFTYKSKYDFKELDSFAFASRKNPEFMHYDLNECATCKVLYASPAPTEADLIACYEEADFSSSEESYYAALTYINALKSRIKIDSTTKALDIGCGDGTFLNQLYKLGCKNLLGLEPSAAPLKLLPPHLQPMVIQKPFSKDALNAQTFNLITFFQTIEHVYEPRKVISEILSSLEDGGILFMVSHNRKAPLIKLMGTKAPIFDIEHLQLFCKESIKWLLKDCGFSTVDVFNIKNTYPLSYWITLLPLPNFIKNKIVKFLKKTYNPLISVSAGNMGIIAKK